MISIQQGKAKVLHFVFFLLPSLSLFSSLPSFLLSFLYNSFQRYHHGDNLDLQLSSGTKSLLDSAPQEQPELTEDRAAELPGLICNKTGCTS
jgi:hypothetical protein